MAFARKFRQTAAAGLIACAFSASSAQAQPAPASAPGIEIVTDEMYKTVKLSHKTPQIEVILHYATETLCLSWPLQKTELDKKNDAKDVFKAACGKFSRVQSPNNMNLIAEMRKRLKTPPPATSPFWGRQL